MSETKQKEIFYDWLKKYKGLLFKIIRAYAFNLHDQEDLFQEITIQVWNSIPNFRGDSAASTWVYRVSLYSAISWSKKEKKHTTGKQSLDGISHMLTEISSFKDSRVEWLYNKISKLNEIDRSLTLLLLDGFSYKEMSNMLGISESNVGVKINRIKKDLIQKSQEEF
jgi:RNA polymerase sigma-70 factor (ECF subfamily)